jgi:small subunit ribosomal protein S16
MVRIRLRRIGLKGQPSYRIVATDKESPRDGRFLEILGFYNPRTEPSTIQLKEDRIYHWMSNGAQPSESVLQIFKSAGLLDRYERYKKGEVLDMLIQESDSAQVVRNVSSKTVVESPATKAQKK